MTYLPEMADKASFRLLTDDERRKLEYNSNVVSDFKQNKYEKEAQKELGFILLEKHDKPGLLQNLKK